jgi:hypothetical protein
MYKQYRAFLIQETVEWFDTSPWVTASGVEILEVYWRQLSCAEGTREQ